MQEFLVVLCRAMRGDVGPRIARGIIQRLRVLRFWSAIGLALAMLGIFYELGAEVMRLYAWLPISAVAAVLLGQFLGSGVETQIRHLNGLALSPFESKRMDMAAAVRMWCGAGIVVLGAVIFAVGIFWAGTKAIPAVGGIAVVLLIVGYVVMSYRTGLAWFSPRWLSYDPKEDEFRRWW